MPATFVRGDSRARFNEVGRLMRSQRVRRALDAKGDRMYAAALAAQRATNQRTEGNLHRTPMSLSRSSGTRPGIKAQRHVRRPYSRLTVQGGYETDRRLLIARAVRSS